MNKKDKLTNKVAVSPSVPLNCSTAAVRGNAKRKTPKQRASRIFNEFSILMMPETEQHLKDFITREIREAVQAELEACADLSEFLITRWENDSEFGKAIKNAILQTRTPHS